MREEMFNELLSSVEEMNKIIRGQIPASRVTKLSSPPIWKTANSAQAAEDLQSVGLFSAEKCPLPRTGIDELDKQRYLHYFKEILREYGEIHEGLLEARGFLVGEGGNLACSYSGYALFSPKPGTRLPSAPIRVTVFSGTDKNSRTVIDEMVDTAYVGLRSGQDTIVQPIHKQVINTLQPFISKERVLEGVQGREWDYPPDAVAEALINALVHRDWTRPDYIRVEAYKDKLVVESPGTLPGGLTVAAMKAGRQAIRNWNLVKVFKEYGYLPNLGLGIPRRIIPLCLNQSGREPDFEETEDSFKVTMYKSKNR